MTVRYDGGAIDGAAAGLAHRLAAARQLVAAAARVAGAEEHGGLVDRHLALAALALADLTGDGAELVARDLQLFVTRLVRGASALDAAEVRLARAAGSAVRPAPTDRVAATPGSTTPEARS